MELNYLKSLESIRRKSNILLENKQFLTSFNLGLENLDEIALDIIKLIKRDYATVNDIPMHSRRVTFN